MKSRVPLVAILMALGTASCEKGYRIRVSNYYLEKLDSVVIGSHNVTFTGVDVHATTDYQPVTSGAHSVRLVTSDGTVFYGMAPLEKGSGGDRTLQVDGLRTVTVLQDQ